NVGASGRPLRIFRSGVPTVVRKAVPAGTLGGGPAGADTPGRFAPERGAAGRGVRRPVGYTRASGSERSNANLSFASSLPASGYSPEKQASQWRSRSPRTASYTPASDRYASESAPSSSA